LKYICSIQKGDAMEELIFIIIELIIDYLCFYTPNSEQDQLVEKVSGQVQYSGNEPLPENFEITRGLPDWKMSQIISWP
jgi:hypothetical protein